MIKLNNAGLDVSGSKNPNWKGGLINKSCCICGKNYVVKRNQTKSIYCSLKCVGISQRGKPGFSSTTNTKLGKRPHKWATKLCITCETEFEFLKSKNLHLINCSKACSYKYRSKITSAEKNPSWNGGISRLPYAHNWRYISKSIIKRDNHICLNESCTTPEAKLCVHHIDYDKQNNNENNLITVCIVCNSKANFGRIRWQAYYKGLLVKIKTAAEKFPFKFVSKQLIKGEWITREL